MHLSPPPTPTTCGTHALGSGQYSHLLQPFAPVTPTDTCHNSLHLLHSAKLVTTPCTCRTKRHLLQPLAPVTPPTLVTTPCTCYTQRHLSQSLARVSATGTWQTTYIRTIHRHLALPPTPDTDQNLTCQYARGSPACSCYTHIRLDHLPTPGTSNPT